MSKSSKYWDKRALQRLSEAEKTSEAYIKRVKAIYDRAYKDLERELASIYKNYSKETGLDTQKLKELLTRSETKKLWDEMKRQGLDKYIKDNYKARISRIEKIQAQIYAKAKGIYPQEELQNTMCYKGVINQSYYKTMYDTQMGTGYDFNFATLDNNMVKAVLQDPWSGKNYSQRIWGNTDILANTLSEMVGGALLSGQSNELTAKQIRDRFNVSKYYAERLIRTETNHFNNEADAMAYEELGLNKYVFVATLDSRTSEICQSMDNQVFDFKDREEGVNFPPLHPNCRSKTRAYLGKEAEKNLKRRARDPKTGKTEIIDNISYREWIKKYTETPNNVDNKQVINNKSAKIVNKIPKIDNFVEKINIKDIDKYLNKYEESIKNADVENAFVIKPNGDVFKYGGSKTRVELPKTGMEKAIITHNHLIDGDVYRSFGEDDYNYIKNLDVKDITLRVVTPEFKAQLKKLKDFDLLYNDLYKEAMKKIFLDESLELHDEVMKILKEKGYIDYKKFK